MQVRLSIFLLIVSIILISMTDNLKSFKYIGDNASSQSVISAFDEKKLSKLIATDENVSFDITEVKYSSNEGHINIVYPKISNYGNKLNDDDINKILYEFIYEFFGFDSLNENIIDILRNEYKLSGNTAIFEMHYEVLYKNENFVCIAYSGSRYGGEGSLYPTSIYKTINIDLTKKERINLNDIVNNFDLFTNIFLQELLLSSDDEFKTYIYKYIYSSNTTDELKSKLQSTDVEGIKYGLYSAITKENLYIIYPVPHSGGDYIKIKLDYK